MRAALRIQRAFGAKVYKVAWDPQGNRLTYLKVTGGSLKSAGAFEQPPGEFAGGKDLGGKGQSNSHLFGRKISGGG